ncbi:MAG: manganese efflux pump [Alicyclobacillaceae bacterium]|nr:manganese efflux pump [Alicyclobacillaceae bacterium]
MDEVWGQADVWIYGEMALVTLALAADVLAVSLKLGLQGISQSDRSRFQWAVGVFHTVLPVAGFFLGERLHGRFGDAVGPVAAAVFLILGIQTLAHAWKNRYQRWILAGPAVVLAFAVSIDAFTTAVTLGFAGLSFWSFVPILALTAWSAARLGFLLGERAGALWGWRAEFAGGVILLLMGLTMVKSLM